MKVRIDDPASEVMKFYFAVSNRVSELKVYL
jgi:hypothetical protein